MAPRNATQRNRQHPPRPRPRTQAAPFNLDAVKADGSDEPYRFTLGGEEYTLSNPRDVDYDDAEAAGNDPKANIRLLMDDAAAYERFAAHSLTLRQVEVLADEVNTYYAVGEDSA